MICKYNFVHYVIFSHLFQFVCFVRQIKLIDFRILLNKYIEKRFNLMNLNIFTILHFLR